MKTFFLTLFVLLSSFAFSDAKIVSNVGQLEQTPNTYTIVFFPKNYQQDAASMSVLRGFGTDQTLIKLRELTQVQTYSVSDPDFQHRFASRLPQVTQQNQNVVLVVQDDAILFGKAGLTGQQLSEELRGCALISRLGNRIFRPHRPYRPNPYGPNQPNVDVCPGPDCPNGPNQPNEPIQVTVPGSPSVTGQPDKPLLPVVTVPPQTQPVAPAEPFVDKINQEVQDQLDQIQDELAETTKTQNALSNQITQVLQTHVEAPKIDFGPIIAAIKDIKPQPVNVDLSPVIAAIDAQHKSFNEIKIALTDLKKSSEVVSLPAVEKIAKVYVLVVSSVLCDDCPDVVAKAKDVRDKKGVNIRIVRLDGQLQGLAPEQKATVRLDGVPALHDFSDGRTIVGSADVLGFLNSL